MIKDYKSSLEYLKFLIYQELFPIFQIQAFKRRAVEINLCRFLFDLHHRRVTFCEQPPRFSSLRTFRAGLATVRRKKDMKP